MTDAVVELVRLPADSAMLEGLLVLPHPTEGMVLFAHGSGSSRHSPRNAFVAAELQARGLATLLVDLLDPREDTSIEARFDVGLLAARLGACAHHLAQDPRTAALPLGLFGASTGAAAALRLAATGNAAVRAVVSRGGRPDLAGAAALERVAVPTLLIVGGSDVGVIGLNQRALALLGCTKELVLVPGATHLFEEPGTLQTAARLAGDWFVRHLVPTATRAR
jgi:putative phosphoribosyl transferase